MSGLRRGAALHVFYKFSFCKFAATDCRPEIQIVKGIERGSAKPKKLATAVTVPANDPIYIFHSTTVKASCQC